ncbi:Gfo/Idh/MocA family protein [Candidatus Stoquefichus massiliensis]|uniref:Gfo/Idh/MocA family protein n=1 Tax=Candidatus Stoquefichus massiliensis TaxID=1470350 RepID=UPI0004891381|nr:Gfo/Idh/MocA family oxidoreductase [Candidatus Stoquefichus massiliensis]
MKKNYHVIIYGNGYWSKILQQHIKSYSYILKIIGIVDIGTIKQKEEEMLEEADLAFVCTPVATHYSIVKKLLLKNIHVFCEKILAQTYEEAIDLYDLSYKRNLLLFVDYTYLYSQGINYIKKNVSLIGTIKSVNGEITQYGKFYPNGNAVETIGVHLFSVLRYIVNRENNYTKNEIIKMNNYKEINNYYYSGRLGNIDIHIHCSLLSATKRRYIEFVGTKGIISYDMLSKKTVKIIIYGEDEKHISFDESSNLDNVIKAVIHHLYNKDYKQYNNIGLKIQKDIDCL